MNRQQLFYGTLAAGVFLLLAVASASAQTAEGYIGNAACIECHQDQPATIAHTGHGRDGFEKLSNRGCETCHGPAKAHSDDPGNEDLYPSVTKLSAQKQVEVCQQCHRTDKQFFWDSGPHAKRDLSCLNCHSVHHFQSQTAQLQSVDEKTQCFTCHKDIRAQTWKRSHHPIREGEITCSDCHNPHGTTTDKQIQAASINDQCYRCHTEKRGPFLWEHAPARENCTTCHTPHGSNHLKLQKTSVPFLCQQCHANTRHPGSIYDGDAVPGGPSPSSREFNRACLNCHSAIHGSNHPSAPYLAH